MPQFKIDFSALCVREENPRVKNHENREEEEEEEEDGHTYCECEEALVAYQLRGERAAGQAAAGTGCWSPPPPFLASAPFFLSGR